MHHSANSIHRSAITEVQKPGTQLKNLSEKGIVKISPNLRMES